MAPVVSTVDKTLDLPALILANCSTFAGPESTISLTTAVNDNNRWSIHVLKARKGERTSLLSAEGDSVISALEELFFQSSRAVHNFKISNGLGYPRQVLVHDEESCSERDSASDVETEDGQMSVSVVSIEEPASAILRLSTSVSPQHRPHPQSHAQVRALTPTPHTLALPLLPKRFDASSAKEQAACLLVDFVGRQTFKVLTRVAPCTRAVEAKAIQLLTDKKLHKPEDGENDAGPPVLRAVVRQVRLGNEDFELDEDMEDDLSSIFSASEIPRFDVEVTTV